MVGYRASLWSLAAVVFTLVLATSVQASLYPFQGGYVKVDYWAGVTPGVGVNEMILVVDWNDTNGPYNTPTHAFGYRWTGSENLDDALTAVDTAGALNLTGVATNFVNYANYDQTLVDGDNHSNQSPMDYNGWVWIGWTDDFGTNWTANAGTLDTEGLVDGRINALNLNPGTWTNGNLTIPIPEPASLVLLGFGSLAMLRRRRSS